MINSISRAKVIRVMGLSGVAIGGLIVGAALAGGTEEVRRARPGEATYSLTGLRFEYPFVEQDSGTVDSGGAAVFHGVDWSGPNDPRERACRIELRSAAGVVVGSLSFKLTSAAPHAEPGRPKVVAVDAAPSTIEGWCDGTASPGQPDGSYRFGSARFSRPDTPGTATVEISFPVDWTSTMHPGLQTCRFTLERSDGTKETRGPIDVYLGEGRDLTIAPVVDRANEIVDAQVSCEQ